MVTLPHYSILESTICPRQDLRVIREDLYYLVILCVYLNVMFYIR